MTTLFNYDPYFDDFDEDKNFMRVLFRPGYSVQARELTQLQTILQNQIEKFGNHIFKSGSPIVGGKISLDDKANYIILNSQYNNIDIVPSDFLDKTIISYNGTKTVRAKVIAIDTTTSNPFLVIKYLSGDVFSESDELKISGQDIFAQVKSTNAVGRSYVASIQEGVYYFKGQFVKVTPQFLVLTLQHRIGYNSTTIVEQPSYKVGIEFDETIIDEVDDTSLLDPAQGAFNYQAPGANRFQIVTTLSKRTLDSADESSFFEVIRLVNGVKTKEIEYPIYSEIEKTMARRTYDESGNYTVDPFVLSLEEGDSANGKFDVVLDPGKAYVGGYEFQTIAPTTIELDRARETANVSDYDISTNYTSYVVLNSIRGSLDIASYPSLDIHAVPVASINVSTNAAYNSTKIGTLRANMMKYNDATTTDVGTTHSFTVNVFDVNNTPITGTLPSSGSTSTVIKLPSSFSSSAPANTYANMYFRLTDAGGSSVAPILITESSTSANTITLTSALPFTPASNTFSIDPDFKVAESVINRSGSSILFGGNVDSDSKDTLTGFASITEPNRSSLIFDLPFNAIKDGTITNFDFYARKVYSNKLSGGDGVITITTEGTDTFAFAGTPGTLSDSVILNNIICFIRSDSVSNGTSGITPNTVCSLANNLFTVTAVSPTTIDIDFNTTGVKADFIITTKVNNADNSSTGAIRGKQLLPLTDDLHAKVGYDLGGANTLTDLETGVTTSVSGTGYVFEDVGATFFDDSTALTNLKTPGVAVSLQVPDVYEIVRITDSLSTSSNVTTAMLTSSVYDVTDNYEFDNGQRKTHYDHATIKLKRGYSSPKGKIYVQYKYLKHQSAPSPQNDGLFTVDSYLKTGSNFTYDEISYFANKEDSKLVPLRSSFDFRPTRAIGSSTISGAVNPDPDLTGIASFEYYLSRIDQIVVKPAREFSVIKGKSSVNPTAPVIGIEDMLIYTLSIPAYTESVKDIRADFKNNRRYTMRDIGAFENRIKQLEYYVSLNSLEKNAASTKVLDANGLERSKYGILVDNFTTTSSQASYNDVGFDNRCLIDSSELQPASYMNTFKLKLIPAACSGAFNVVGAGDKKVLMLDYTQSEFAKQPYATKSIPVASALFANFRGNLQLFPEYTAEVDTSVTAKVTLNSLEGIENTFNFINDAFKYISDKTPKWADDKNSPFAKIADSKWYETKPIDYTYVASNFKGVQNPNGFSGSLGHVRVTGDEVWLSQGAELQQKQISTKSSEVDVGSFVTDLAIQPYLKPKLITFNSVGLRPNTTFYSYFDDVAVNKYVVAPNEVTLNISSGLVSGETALIANTISDLAANLSSWNSGGLNYDAVVITNSEVNSNNVSIVNETGKPLSGKYVLGLDSGKYAVINSVNSHKSGRTRALTTSTITLASDAPSVNISGNTIYLVRASGSLDGVGEEFNISTYNTSTKVVTVDGTITSNTSKDYTYSIGVNKSNKLGQVSGVFFPPSATFRSGERKFRVTESFNNTYDTDAVSFAEHTYVSSGLKVSKTTLVDTVYNVSVDPQVVGTTTSAKLISSNLIKTRLDGWDPLAQTFYVDPQVYPNGMFLASADLFFKSKDAQNLPVSVQIRPTVNGAPHSDFWYPESVVEKYPSEVNISDNPITTSSSTKTNFEFKSPVFLKPGLYAIVVITQSPDYILWVAEKGAQTIRNEFVGVNPYIGTLYKSQNSMEYVPFINEDMMFILNRCVFSSSSANFSLQSESQTKKYNIDKFRLLQTSLDPMDDAPITLNYSFVSKPVGASKETTYRSIMPQIKYSMGEDSLYSIGYRRKELQSQGDFTINIEMASSDDSISPVVSLESLELNAWENYIDNGEISSDNFNIIASGSGYSNSNVVTVTSSTGTGAEIYLNVDASGNVIGINVASSGTGYTDDFSISYYTHPTTPATIVLNSEYDSAGGVCDAKYITKPITLADGFDAGDLRVFLAANKPGVSEIEVFYKLLSSTDTTNFNDRPYMKMVCYNPTTTASKTSDEFREYEYRPSLTTNSITYTSDNGTTYDTFKTFAIKIVMTSNDPSVIPKVKDLRIIALPAE